MTTTAATLTASEISALIDGVIQGGNRYSIWPERFAIATHALTHTDDVAYYVDSETRQHDPYDEASAYTVYRVMAIELTGTWTGATEQLGGDFRTLEQAIARRDEHVALSDRQAAARARVQG